MAYRVGRCLLRQHLSRIRKSQKWLAENTGFTESRISDYIRNQRQMSLPAAKSIAVAIGCTIDDLYEWEIVDESESE